MSASLEGLALEGTLTIFSACEKPENVILGIDGEGEVQYLEGREALREAPLHMRAEVKKYGHLFLQHEPNGFVTNGLDIALNLLFGVGGPPSKIQSMIVAKSATAVAATDTSILGGATAPVFTTASQNALSKLVTSPAPVASVAGAITAGMSFTQADVTGGANFWPINRIGLVNVAASTNLGLVDIIGNIAAQADPYSRTFSADYSAAGSFTLNPQITIQGVRRVADFPVL